MYRGRQVLRVKKIQLQAKYATANAQTGMDVKIFLQDDGG